METNEQKTEETKPEYNRKWYHFYKYCSDCPHRNDAHDMNCIECCPVKLKQVESDLYENQGELAEKQVKALDRILRG